MSFDRFWAAYPRHVAKGAAQKAWEKLSPDDEMTQRIILSISAQKSYRWKMDEVNGSLPEKQKRFVPDWKHPATWLNQACWDDELIKVMREHHKENTDPYSWPKGLINRDPMWTTYTAADTVR